MTEVKFAIIGCGLIGKKRAAHLPPGSVAVVCDKSLEIAQALAKTLPGCQATASVDEALGAPGVGAVIIATPNSLLAPIAKKAIQKGKHVLMEKPGGLNATEVTELRAEEKNQKVCVRVGFNHRYHPAFIKAREILASGVAGPLMFIRGRYGHGGRLGYEKEWRADPKLSGGGELIDQGVHLIDLAQSFLGSFEKIEGHASTYFWNMPVDDNAFISLRTPKNQTAWLQVSCTEWKNLFSFEIYGRNAKLHIEGLGGSYGIEKLHYYQMLPQMGPPETTVFEYPRGDESWRVEMNEFLEDIKQKRTPSPGLKEAEHALQVVETIYRRS